MRRDGGEPFYLPVGQAEALRSFAKESLRCPYPDCEVTITTSGGSRRDHFRHLNAAEHPGGVESEFHLAAKAMIAAWLREHAPEGARVREEQSLKDPATALHRRPDVTVTGRSGRQVAYEVEYKSWSIESWRAKQEDLDRAGVRTLWLIGHTRLRLAADEETVVIAPQIVTEMRGARRPVLVVNPVTREVGTLESLVGNLHGPGPFRLFIASLEECWFDERCGIMTPRLERLLEREAIKQERRRLDEAAQEARRERLRILVEERHSAWIRSDLHRHLVAEYGQVPWLLEKKTLHESEVWADGTHWRAVVWDALVRERPARFQFRMEEAFDALGEQHISLTQGIRGAMAVDAWLQVLVEAEILYRVEGDRGAIGPTWPHDLRFSRGRVLSPVSQFEVSGLSIIEAQDRLEARAQQTDERAEQAERVQGPSSPIRQIEQEHE